MYTHVSKTSHSYPSKHESTQRQLHSLKTPHASKHAHEPIQPRSQSTIVKTTADPKVDSPHQASATSQYVSRWIEVRGGIPQLGNNSTSTSYWGRNPMRCSIRCTVVGMAQADRCNHTIPAVRSVACSSLTRGGVHREMISGGGREMSWSWHESFNITAVVSLQGVIACAREQSLQIVVVYARWNSVFASTDWTYRGRNHYMSRMTITITGTGTAATRTIGLVRRGWGV